MKSVNRDRFINIWFDRYLEKIMSTDLSRDYLQLLNEDDHRALANRTRWIADASLEQKLLLLTRLGYPLAVVVGSPQRVVNKPALLKMVTIFFRCLTWKKRDAVNVMRDKFFFCLSDLDIVKGLQLASNLYNSPAAASFAGLGGVTEKMYVYKSDAQRNAIKDKQAGHDIDGIVINALNLQMDYAQASFKNIYGINEKQYIILAILSKHRECTISELNKLTKGMRKALFHLRGLTEMRYIERKRFAAVALDTEDHYWLTGLGEQALIKARNYFIKHL